jgi:hypothetical protein
MHSVLKTKFCRPAHVGISVIGGAEKVFLKKAEIEDVFWIHLPVGNLLHIRFRNKLIFYGEELLAPRPTT